ncbi:hypothetical protein PRIPAC_88903 [Pristionchus pacificus]|uniref:Uncharacterized protein n=1 Tax=Pristionchus pacificus TaxID=54126 RepID=A0A2A6B796_PRIPA|nr:hypothetical protein PRIPAC_88903 [Pristionchus pacificus]|eukprot:PDM61741.1 hypothetical protein PRIPAC_51183 [Pristionchus pacificus]
MARHRSNLEIVGDAKIVQAHEVQTVFGRRVLSGREKGELNGAAKDQRSTPRTHVESLQPVRLGDLLHAHHEFKDLTPYCGVRTAKRLAHGAPTVVSSSSTMYLQGREGRSKISNSREPLAADDGALLERDLQ